MQQRFNLMEDAPESFKVLLALEMSVRKSGLEPRLAHLIKIRASQINGCAYCVDMHVRDARAAGLPTQWIDLMSVWQESPLYDERERAVLGFVDEVTNVAATRIGDAAYGAMTDHFSVQEIAKILVAIGMINVWNRMSLAQRLMHPIDEVRSAA
ncbi:carboxymuconolactone decarboxylase family protein [Acuticoccus sediminis]|uniref:carboxymuconolactone decarboxylase family protein n=1 Tax=Acuticoccus sediminis TaxID=2184697 RepID=UPI001CFC98BB|nr:carboxymuconolactone decarboxylase family protein [Acuticoccus sediminis]